MPWFEPSPSARNGHEGPNESEILRQRIAQAVEEADLAFWKEIATRFPEVTSGDFPPDATFAWDRARDEAVYRWLVYNHPKSNVITAMRPPPPEPPPEPAPEPEEEGFEEEEPE